MTAESFTCPRCGRTSHHPMDVANRYCGACHVFHPEPGEDPMDDDPKEFCVMLQLRTNDPRLTVEAINAALGSGNASDFARVRRAVLQHLPKDVTRLIAMFPVEHARMLMMLHEIHGDQIATHLRENGIAASTDGIFVRPPSDYVPPTQE